MSRVKAAFLGTVSSQVFMVVGMLLTIFTTPIIVKILPKEEYGFSIILFQLVNYFSLFDFGLGAAVNRFLAMNRGESEKEHILQIINTAFLALLFLGIVVVCAGLIFIPFLPDVFDVSNNIKPVIGPVFITTCIMLALQFPTKSFTGLFYAHQHQIISNSIGFVTSIVSITATVIFVYQGYGLWAFVYSNIITILINIITNIIMVYRFYPWIRIKFDKFNKPLLKEMFNYGIHIFIIGIAVQVVFSSDRIITGSLISLSVVGIYSLTMRMPEIAMSLVMKISESVFPAIVEISAKENLEKFRNVHQTLMITVTSLMMVCFWIILSLNKHFLEIWVGPEFYAGDLVLILFLILTVLLGAVSVSSSCLSASGYITKLSKYTLVEAGLNIILSILLGKLFGLPGIILATVLATLVTSNTITPIAIRSQLGISIKEYFLRPIIYPVVGVSSIGIVLYYLSQNFFVSYGVSWMSLFFIGGVIGVTLLSFVWFLFLKKNLYPYLPEQFKLKKSY